MTFPLIFVLAKKTYSFMKPIGFDSRCNLKGV